MNRSKIRRKRNRTRFKPLGINVSMMARMHLIRSIKNSVLRRFKKTP